MENQLDNIFTEIDDGIFADGSIDPMGLRLIWTSLGNKIFGNKLNTISTDIRYYTLNLFHHSIIYTCLKKYPEKFLNLTGVPPYNNYEDLYDGLIIFMECLIAHAFTSNVNHTANEIQNSIPGILKLSGLKNNSPENEVVKYLQVDKRSGILVRHISLGIHGRHKGPFQQMNIFAKNNYYFNENIWNQVETIFNVEPWKNIKKEIIDIIFNRILSAKHISNSTIKIKIQTINFSEELKHIYELDKLQNYRIANLVSFWEKQIGLLDGNAGVLYNCVKEMKNDENWQLIIEKAIEKSDDNKILIAISTIEPFLSCIEKITNKLLQRGTCEINTKIEQFIINCIERYENKFKDIDKFLSNEFIDNEPKKRLLNLLKIYYKFKNDNKLNEFVHGLIDYHKKIMETRGNLPWISIGVTNKITLHHSFVYNKNYIIFLKNDQWVNSYYLPTVKSLYNGLYT